jgi:hypothetical protein
MYDALVELQTRKRKLCNELAEVRHTLKLARRKSAKTEERTSHAWNLQGEVLDITLALYGMFRLPVHHTPMHAFDAPVHCPSVHLVTLLLSSAVSPYLPLSSVVIMRRNIWGNNVGTPRTPG